MSRRTNMFEGASVRKVFQIFPLKGNQKWVFVNLLLFSVGNIFQRKYELH